MKEEEKEQVTATSGLGRRSLTRHRFLGVAGAVAVGLVAGLLTGGGPKLLAHGSGVSGIEFGPRVDVAGLKENFAPQEVKGFTVPPAALTIWLSIRRTFSRFPARGNSRLISEVTSASLVPIQRPMIGIPLPSASTSPI